MPECYDSKFRFRMRAERILMMLPLNVVMVARIVGNVDIERLNTVLERLRRRHALLAVRVEVDEDNVAWYRTEGVPGFTIKVIPRKTDDDWIQAAEEEYKIPFPLETGPLVRFTLLHSPEVSELVICGHHAVCDGSSLAFLIRDILQHLSDSDREVETLPPPPPIDDTTVPSPLKPNFIAEKFLTLLNSRWNAKGLRFDGEDLRKLHRVYWEKNEGIRVLAWELPESRKSALHDHFLCTSAGA